MALGLQRSYFDCERLQNFTASHMSLISVVYVYAVLRKHVADVIR